MPAMTEASNTYYQDFMVLRNKVLMSEHIGKEYFQQTTSDTTCRLSSIQYLGTITTKDKKTYKLLNQTFVLEPSCRSTSSITIYNMRNQYI